MSDLKKWYKSIGYYYNSIENFFFRRVFPALGIAFLLVVTTPLDKIVPWKLDTNLQLSLLIFFSVAYGSKLLHATLSKGDKKLLSFSSQDSAIENALSLIPKKGTNVDILIYTSFSLFSNIEKLVKKFPGLENSNVRLLIKNPDNVGYPLDSNLSKTRQVQMKTVLDSLVNNASSSKNFFVKFYDNEPWIRGIKIGGDSLFVSTYSNKSEFSNSVNGDGYSGSSTPWIEVASNVPNVLPKEVEPAEKFTSSFDSLFNLIWNKCSFSRALIIDLDGTLYKDEGSNDYFYNQVPEMYFKYLIDLGIADEKMIDQYLDSYNQYRRQGCSGTVSIVSAVTDLYDGKIGLSDYLDWKDENSLQHAKNLVRNESLINSLSIAGSYYRIFILTNHTRKFTLKALEMLGLSSVVKESNVITANDLNCIKPNSIILDKLVQAYDVDLQSAIFIGDRKEIDFEYNIGIAKGHVLVENPNKLPDFLVDCWLPYSWLYENRSKYNGLQLSIRGDEV